jgi:ACS family hexuronate transporter-like MFS transporter
VEVTAADARATEPPDRVPVPAVYAWLVACLLFASVTLNFIDRLVLANVAPSLQLELHLSNTQYSYIVLGFMTGMTLGQLPVGMVIDWFGARLALPGILTAWSVLNILHALARGVVGFCSLRFLMGFFECGNYPAVTKVIGGLFPARQRALALAFVDCGSLFGSVIAPPLVVLILLHFGWHFAFLLPGLLGLLWIVPWFRIYREPQAPFRADTDVQSTGPNVRALLRRRQTWGVVLMRGLTGPISQFYWYWLPLYLVNGRGLSLAKMATFSSFAFFLGGMGNLVGGAISGWLIRKGITVNASRKLVFTAGAMGSASAALIPLVTNVDLAIGVVGLAIFSLNFTSNTLLATITDVFPDQTLARVTGLTGIGEGVLNVVVTLTTGIVVDRFSFAPVFAGAGVLPLLSIFSVLVVLGPIHKITFPAVALSSGREQIG